MTPKEKAEELVKIMSFAAPLYYEESKQCAIKAVNEILNAFSNTFDDYVVESSKVGGYKNMKKYWEEVKQELEKL